MNTTIDDVDSHIVYSSNPAWNTGVWAQQSPQPLYGTNHGTPNPGAIATFTFTGTAVYVYGYKASDHGYRDVSIDGANPVRCDGRTGSQGSRALVYWAEGLSAGTHDITFQHTGVQGQYLNLDYFLVTPSDGSATVADNNPSSTRGGSSASSTNTGGVNNQTSSPIGIIVGVVVAVAVLSLIILAWFLWRRRRKARQQQQPEKRIEPLLEGSAGAWNSKPMPTVTGSAPHPHIQPYYTPVSTNQPPQPHYSVPPTFGGQQQQQQYPESSSGYYSHTEPTQSVYSSTPSTSSPPTQPRFLPMATTAQAVPEARHTPWASSSSAESAGDTAQTTTSDPSITKARYSRATTNTNTSAPSSRPFSFPVSPTADESVPPPRYEQ